MLDLKEMKDKVSDSTYLTVKKNTFCYDDALIQVSNISNITIGSSTETNIPLWLSYSLLACMALWIISLITLHLGLAFLFFMSLVGLFCIISIRFSKKKIIMYLNLHLNSGNKISFRCEDEKFLKDVVRLIDNSMNTGRAMKINFKDCNVSAKQIGENNQIHENTK